MVEANDPSKIWTELRFIVIAYAILTVIYAFVLYAIYGQKHAIHARPADLERTGNLGRSHAGSGKRKSRLAV
jgi:hypothetical protein